MEVLSGHHRPSSLNPNAPVFVPMSYYAAVEDFSGEWWDLVQSSSWFRDFWLHECFHDDDELLPQLDAAAAAAAAAENDFLLLPDFDVFFDDYVRKQEEEIDDRRLISMAMAAGDKWNKKSSRGAVKSSEKVPKIVKNVRVTPRTINQPR